LVVNGNVPFKYPPAYRGAIDPADIWLHQMSSLMAYITDHTFWNKKVQSVSVENTRDIIIIPQENEPLMKIGDLAQFDYKMDKLREFYRVLVPRGGMEKYSAIDARFGNQLVCTHR
jgi:cell division protein FtsQ